MFGICIYVYYFILIRFLLCMSCDFYHLFSCLKCIIESRPETMCKLLLYGSQIADVCFLFEYFCRALLGLLFFLCVCVCFIFSFFTLFALMIYCVIILFRVFRFVRLMLLLILFFMCNYLNFCEILVNTYQY